jgi:hypothetical protein
VADDQTFARLHDLASIPITHALFAEHSDVTDVIMKTPLVGFSELLSNPKANAVLKYFLVSLRYTDSVCELMIDYRHSR